MDQNFLIITHVTTFARLSMSRLIHPFHDSTSYGSSIDEANFVKFGMNVLPLETSSFRFIKLITKSTNMTVALICKFRTTLIQDTEVLCDSET